MNRRYSIIALFTLALGAAALAAPEASAQTVARHGSTCGSSVVSRFAPVPGSEYTTPQCQYPDHPVCEMVPGPSWVEPALHQSHSAVSRFARDPGSGYTTPQCEYPDHPVCEMVPGPTSVEAALDQSPSDGNGTEGLRAGASALGGAGLAFGGMWLYRRRHEPTI
jgi:hypothetical protein